MRAPDPRVVGVVLPGCEGPARDEYRRGTSEPALSQAWPEPCRRIEGWVPKVL